MGARKSKIIPVTEFDIRTIGPDSRVDFVCARPRQLTYIFDDVLGPDYKHEESSLVPILKPYRTAFHFYEKKFHQIGAKIHPTHKLRVHGRAYNQMKISFVFVWNLAERRDILTKCGSGSQRRISNCLSKSTVLHAQRRRTRIGPRTTRLQMLSLCLYRVSQRCSVATYP